MSISFRSLFRILWLGWIGSGLSPVWAGPVQTLLEDWKDPTRDRTVPVKIYCPQELSEKNPLPVVLYSHGLGGSREIAQSILSRWAQNGYIVIAVQHPGSDVSVWQGRPDGISRLISAANAQQLLNRIQDIHFVLDHLQELDSSGSHILHKKMNLSRISMTGHSFGAYTTLAVAGQTRTIGNKTLSTADPRITCAIVMSPSPPSDKNPREFEKIRIPIFHMTGTKDTSPVQPDLKPEDRTLPYQQIRASNQYLVVFQDGDHMMFTGRGIMGRKYADLIVKSSVAFLDAFLKQDSNQKNWLDKEFVQELGPDGRFEHK